MFMRKRIWGSIVSVALLGSGLAACKKSSTEKSGENVKKTQEDLLREEHGMSKQEGKLTDAEHASAAARTRFMTEANARLAKADTKIEELSQKSDPGSQQMVSSLKNERAQVAQRIDKLAKEDTATWDEDKWRSAKAGVEGDFDKLETDINQATH